MGTKSTKKLKMKNFKLEIKNRINRQFYKIFPNIEIYTINGVK